MNSRKHRETAPPRKAAARKDGPARRSVTSARPAAGQPPIERYMTLGPHCIGKDQPLAVARSRMHEFKVRHLPVLDGGKLVGILSERDLDILEGFDAVDPETVTVEEAMTPDPYVVAPTETVLEVARTMATRKIGSAIVAERGKVVGVFTTIDALWTVVDHLEGRT